MLSILHIENIAVVERADVEFGPRLGVLTGETGAGKSIIIDAINAILGMRTSRDIIRTGERTAAVSAVFTGVSETVRAWLEEHGYEDGTEELLITRQLGTDGRNVCRIGGLPVTVSMLRELGALLVGIHGQHDSQQLLDDALHLRYLDSFAEHGALIERYTSAYGELISVRRKIEKLSMDTKERARRVDELHRRIEEIESAELQEGEEEELTARSRLLRNAGRITSALENAYAALYGDEETGGASALLNAASEELSVIEDTAEELSALSSRLKELCYSAEDIAEELRDQLRGLDFSPEEVDQVESRLDTIAKLERKYGASIPEVLAALEEYRSELGEIEYSDEAMAALEEREKKLSIQVKKAAAELTASRRAAADRLEKRICTELSDLDMRAVFMVSILPVQPGPEGADAVQFLLSANAGEEPRPLSRIASGGELARIMLAMKNVLAENDDLGTLIFDEVDAGVSGRAAQRVAEKLASLGRKRQVLCVSHLPQLAAMADEHFLIEKRERDGRTFTSVTPLDLDGRIREIARITGGANITENTRKNAAEMIEAAEKYKEKLQ